MTIPPELNQHQARVLGVLIEKQLTTPDNYPLSLNALTSGCNQKSNRNPVLDLSETEVRKAFEQLRVAHLAGAVQTAGARVEKYKHSAEAALGVSSPQLAVLAELCLRGPQSPGDLRGRVNRMTSVPSLSALQELLDSLMQVGLVLQLAPLPGSRAVRFEQVLAPGLHSSDAGGGMTVRSTSKPNAESEPSEQTSPSTVLDPDLGNRVATLESEVRTLRNQLASLAGRLGESLDELA